MDTSDTDKQGTAYELIGSRNSRENVVKHVLSVTGLTELSMVTLDSLMQRMRVKGNSLTLRQIRGWLTGNVWQLAMMCRSIIVPTSLSWANVRPTIEFVKEIDERKIGNDTVTPHLIIVPNKIPPSTTRFYPSFWRASNGLNVVLLSLRPSDYRCEIHVREQFYRP